MLSNTALIVFITSAVLGLILVMVVYKERRRGRRFFAVKFRNWLDTKVAKAGNGLVNGWEHFCKYVVQLNWYYSIHSFWRAMLKVTAGVYTYFENHFERNRRRTKQLRSEKRQLSEFNHLQQMSEHKAETALSAAEKRKLNKKHLDGKV